MEYQDIKIELQQLIDEGVSEEGHEKADNLLIQVAKNTTFTQEERNELVQLFLAIEKWYA